MAFAGGGLNRPSTRDSAPGPRFFFFAVLSVVLMYYDQRDGWSSNVRYALQAAAYPVQVAVGSPRKFWNGMSGFFESRDSLRAENAKLLEREQVLSLTAMRYAALEKENARLRALDNSLPPLVKRFKLADVVSADLSRVRQRLVVDKGDGSGLYRSQPAVDASGLLGQIVRLGPFSSELMLITDPAHAVPVEVLRNGLRTIAMGTGSSSELDLPLVPANSDVKIGDLLVTSGLGGVFPAGVPVGVVTQYARDPDQILAVVRARPSATLSRDHQVMLLWFDPTHPAAPVNSALIEKIPPEIVGQPVVDPPKAPANPKASSAAAKSGKP
jgi:rod shape-determining protein MreC